MSKVNGWVSSTVWIWGAPGLNASRKNRLPQSNWPTTMGSGPVWNLRHKTVKLRPHVHWGTRRRQGNILSQPEYVGRGSRCTYWNGWCREDISGACSSQSKSRRIGGTREIGRAPILASCRSRASSPSVRQLPKARRYPKPPRWRHLWRLWMGSVSFDLLQSPSMILVRIAVSLWPRSPYRTRQAADPQPAVGALADPHRFRRPWLSRSSWPADP